MRERISKAKKHDLYLSSRIWGELKQKAFQEHMTVSQLITFILDHFLSDPPQKITLSRYQLRGIKDGKHCRHTLYVPDVTWLPVNQAAKRGGFSITVLVDFLAKDYLGIDLLETD